jgi:alpha-1,2-mannosyltransferase
LMHLPEGHKGRIASALRAQWLDLSAPVAGVVIKAGMFVLLASTAWKFRRRVLDRQEEVILWEAAVVSLLILLYSPLTWRQHCVAVFPAFYLISRTAIAKAELPSWIRPALGVYVVLVLLLDRGVVGREMTLVLDSFGATTWSLLILLGVTLGCHSLDAKRTPQQLTNGVHKRIKIKSKTKSKKMIKRKIKIMNASSS